MTMLPSPHLSQKPSNSLAFYGGPTPSCFSSSTHHLMASEQHHHHHHHQYSFSVSNNIHANQVDPDQNPNTNGSSSPVDPEVNNSRRLLVLGSGLVSSSGADHRVVNDAMVEEEHSRTSNSVNEITQAEGEIGPSNKLHHHPYINHEHEGSSWLQIGLTSTKDPDPTDPGMGQLGLGRGTSGGGSTSDGLMLELNLGGGPSSSTIPPQSQPDQHFHQHEYSYFRFQPPTANNLTPPSLVGGVAFLPQPPAPAPSGLSPSAAPYPFQQGEYGWSGLIRTAHNNNNPQYYLQHHHHQYYNHQQRPSSSFMAAGSSLSPSASSSSGSVMPATFLGRAGITGPGFDGSGPTTNIRVMDPPPRRPHSGIWFMLQASQHQGREPYLPQVSRSFLRIKDGRMTVRLVMKYLANKLGLDSESEVEVRCRGQELVPLLTLQHVRDNIWSSSGDVITLLPESSTSDHVMVLHYSRSSSST